MAVSAITSLKNIIGYKGSTGKGSGTSVRRGDSLEPVPTVGFRVSYTKGTTRLQVRLLGARHLPAKVGGTPATGYTIKVCTTHMKTVHVQWVHCHHGMARPRVADRGDGLQIWRVKKSKAVLQHTYGRARGAGGIAPTHSRPQH
jgi:hypothetical protein